MAWICGVEEAGRGPVLGPMVMACCWVEEKGEESLRSLGAKDSKLLTPQQREGTLDRLEQAKREGKVGFELVILSPQQIDAAVESERDNLNHLELRTSAMLINRALKEQPLIAKALIDCPTKNTAKYAADIAKLLDERIEVIAEHKADVTYPVVSAASIIAKVTRDKEIEKIKAKIGKNIGSGYPADPFTKDFLRKNYKKEEYASFFRKSWATYKTLLESGKQRSIFHFETESEEEKEREKRHGKELREFEALKQHGFEFVPPTNQYEVVRAKKADATVIKYTTGKVIVQGKGKEAVTKLLKRLGLKG